MLKQNGGEFATYTLVGDVYVLDSLRPLVGQRGLLGGFSRPELLVGLLLLFWRGRVWHLV